MSVDATQDRCPRCAGPNRCALTLPEAERPGQCWCVGRRFPASLLEGVAPTACVCEACCDQAGDADEAAMRRG